MRIYFRAKCRNETVFSPLSAVETGFWTRKNREYFKCLDEDVFHCTIFIFLFELGIEAIVVVRC
jgi:hypothetical protein